MPTLVFDGDCAFCTTTAHWMRDRLPAEVVVVPWQRADLTALGLTEDQTRRAAWWVDDDGRTAGGHQAVGRAAATAGGWWQPVAWACQVPPLSWLAAVAYRLVARFRHRLPGGTPACRLEP